MIHVCYGLHDGNGRYSKFTGTSILSMFEHTRAEVTVHIFHDSTLTDANRERFLTMAKNFGQTINFYDVETICAEELAHFRALYPAVERKAIGTMCRLWAGKILSEEITKAIYLDADTVVNLDIDELWQINLEGNTLAAISELENGAPVEKYFALCRNGIVARENYFNAGVMVIDLKKFRDAAKLLKEGLDFIASNHDYCFFDQDVLNYCFQHERLTLPLKFNRFVEFARNANEDLTPAIYHYAGGDVSLYADDAFNKLWAEYFLKSNWFDGEVFYNLCAAAEKICVEEKDFAIKISALVSGRTRAFYFDADNLQDLINLFKVQDGEEVIVADSRASIRALMNSMINSQDKKIFIIAVAFYRELAPILEKAGFIKGKDFMDGTEFFVSRPLHKLISAI